MEKLDRIDIEKEWHRIYDSFLLEMKTLYKKTKKKDSFIIRTDACHSFGTLDIYFDKKLDT
jgi:hypothetical protein